MTEICSAFVENASLLTSLNGDIGLILVELLDLSRALRARFAGCDQRGIIALYIEHSIPATVVMLCSWFNSTSVLKEAPGSAELLTQKKTLVLVLCQIVANFTACGEDARHHLVSLSFDSLSHVLSSAIMTENRKAVAAFLGALYNCLLTNDTDSPSVQEAAQRRREAFVSNRGFLCQVLLSVLDTSKTNLTGANKPGEPSAPQEDPSLEWFHMLANIWVKHNLISRMFTVVGPSTALEGQSIEDIVHVTHEQVHYTILFPIEFVLDSPLFVVVSLRLSCWSYPTASWRINSSRKYCFPRILVRSMPMHRIPIPQARLIFKQNCVKLEQAGWLTSWCSWRIGWVW